MERKEVKENIWVELPFGGQTFSGTLGAIRNNIDELERELNKTYGNKYHNYEIEHSCYYDSGDWDILGIRWETDKELDTRRKKAEGAKKAAKKRKENLLRKEKEQYEKLKAKFEKQ